jgi:pyruvate/2-oxoglutarate dehydrogenase complex dihydrolipoamide dehydrogenase (E3) component
MDESRYFAIVIGAGAAGLVVAKGLATAKKKVLLIEKDHWGGDCTNFGCIPSKTLIHLAKEMHILSKHKTPLSTGNLFSHVHSIVEKIQKEETPDALKKDKIETVTGTAFFVDPHTVQVGDKKYSAKYIIIATGASAKIPTIEGLDKAPFYTNETIFTLTKPPKSLIVIGGGPIGCELAQAFARIGTKVSLIHKKEHLLDKEAPQIGDILASIFTKENIDLYLSSEPVKVDAHGYQTEIHIKNNNSNETTVIPGEAILVAVGRVPQTSLLQLENAKIATSNNRILVDKYGRTSQKHIYAIGDSIGPPYFTHVAENQARSVIASILLPWKQKLSLQAIPRVTYTDPEIASIGLTEDSLVGGMNRYVMYELPLDKVDRAITQDETEGLIRLITSKWSSKIVGATIIAPRAGEMLMEIALAMKEKIPMRKLASLIHPYPTYSLGIRQTSDQWLTKTILPLFSKGKKG